MRGRRLRRMVGLLHARVPELELERVPDPRAREGRWALPQILVAVLTGLMAGSRSLSEAEQLTEDLSPGVRRLLGLPRRLPDTTMRDALCRVPHDGLRAALHRIVHAAWRRKALAPVGLPVSVAALDGKVTALPCWDDQFVQRHNPEQGLPFGVARTVTCALVSAAGRPCIDAIPIPAATNEMGHFQTAFASVVETYGALFQVVSYDAGALSEANGRAVVNAGKDYLFRLRGDQRTMYKLAEELLEPGDAVARTVDHLDSQTCVTRTLVLLPVKSYWAYGNGKTPEESVWRHARTFLRVESVKLQAGAVVASEVRLYVSSLDTERMTPSEWLYMVRCHWGVENDNHNTLDTAFAEDKRPWITCSPQGMLAVLLLRRIAYTMLALFRAVTLRSEKSRAMPWKNLLGWVQLALVAAAPEHIAGLRLREITAATR